MRERYVEDPANHDDPESCVGIREGVGEALTGEHAGRVLSREKFTVQGADAVEKSGRQHSVARHGECHTGPAWSEDLSHAWKPLAWEPGDPLAGRLGSPSRAVRIGKVVPVIR